MCPITFLFNEVARVRLCLALCALTFLGVGLSAVFLLILCLLLLSVGDYTSLVDRYNGDFLMFELKWLWSVALLLNLVGCYMSFMAMYPERRAQSLVSMLFLTFLQLCLVVAFACFSVLCYVYADDVENSFKVYFLFFDLSPTVILLMYTILPFTPRFSLVLIKRPRFIS